MVMRKIIYGRGPCPLCFAVTDSDDSAVVRMRAPETVEEYLGASRSQRRQMTWPRPILEQIGRERP